METLDQWIDRQYRYSATAMLSSISRVDIVKERPGFGTRITAARGSVIASPILAAYDPDPDYFFHWYRDSAVVIESLRILFMEGVVGPEALVMFGDFVRFGLSLRQLDGDVLTGSHAWRDRVAPDFARYLRSHEELACIKGDAAFAETRVNPDGTLDISTWARPQHDGPALTVLALLGWVGNTTIDAALSADIDLLIGAHLDFTRAHWRESSFDIWEEEKGQHYYTLRVSAAALEQGSRWLQHRGERDKAAVCTADAAEIHQVLDGFWLAEAGHYRSRLLESGVRSTKELDIAVILSAIHCGTPSRREHSVHDPKMQATLDRLAFQFGQAYPINRGRSTRMGPAMGRYPGDVYYSGGAYYFSTLGAAEFCFRAAVDADNGRQWLERGDAFLDTVRLYTPNSGELSEQFDQVSGVQTSARHLAWSYAAFISCVAARRRSQVSAG